jgi:hypothetical protein
LQLSIGRKEKWSANDLEDVFLLSAARNRCRDFSGVTLAELGNTFDMNALRIPLRQSGKDWENYLHSLGLAQLS